MAGTDSSLSSKLRKHLPDNVLTDDIAYDDIICASGELTKHLQHLVDTYNLTGQQLVATIQVALEGVAPDERLYAAIDGSTSTQNNVDN